MTIKQLQVHSRGGIERALTEASAPDLKIKSLEERLQEIREQEAELSEYLERGFSVISQYPITNGVNLILYRTKRGEGPA